MEINKVGETVNIRVFRSTRDRLKVRAAKEKKSIVRLVEELLKQNYKTEVLK